MASSSAARARVACDACAAGAWVGPAAAGGVAWCEACQLASPGDGACAACGGPLTRGAPRFTGLWGELQHLDAVLAAWAGDPAPLLALLPERPAWRTDLDPPAARDADAPALRARLADLQAGRWAAVLAAPDDDDPRAHAARAIAHERLGAADAALAEWTAVLAAGEDARARLARGALRARARQWEGAAADFARAGDGPAARWNRAALRVRRAVAGTPGMPDARELVLARAEAGPASEYWSEPTVGRFAFALLAERALERREAGELADLDLVTLRAAEDLLEHATFWDRALVLAAHARLAQDGDGDAGRVAQPLAREIAGALLAEPAVKSRPLALLAAALERAWDAAVAFDPRTARAAVAPWLGDPVLRRYRVPCAACGRGSVGVEAWEDAPGSPGV